MCENVYVSDARVVKLGGRTRSMAEDLRAAKAAMLSATVLWSVVKPLPLLDDSEREVPNAIRKDGSDEFTSYPLCETAVKQEEN